MDEHQWLANRFEEHRNHLPAVAYRMLGSLSEAEDAVQEAWLRVSRAGTSGVENLGGWLTTVVARVSLNMLESRRSRREEPLGESVSGHVVGPDTRTDPENEALLADSVGVALLVVLETLTPVERLALVLHDTFGLPFEEIAPVVDRTPTATRQIASRARRRIRGEPAVPDVDLTRQRQLIDAFLAAARKGDFDALLAVLDPDVVLRADRAAVAQGATRVVRGAYAVAEGALSASERARSSQPALVDGTVGLVVAPRGQLLLVLRFTTTRDTITEIDVIADPARLRRLDLAVL